ncbi:MAG TPA: sulfatase-like hydrolase/transferase [Pirellulales bacterium]|nr:sulfatase-like hydrolase/transferase [Pirellulales bacterium]
MLQRVMGFLALLLAMPTALQAAGARNEKPNIVFFLIDDLGYADCGFNGGTEIQTPNIDRLARQGTVLESHYVQPVCSPTRAALMTGRYATRTGVYTIVRPHAAWGLPLEERTLANALKEAGYSTAITGKWHLGEFEPAYRPLARGFDHQYGHYFGAIDYFTHERDGDLDWYREGKQLEEEGYSTHLVTKEACRLIASHEKTKPLFLYVPYNGIHSPFQVPDRYLEPYSGLTGNRRTLAGMLAAVDEGIGQIVDALAKSDMRENTLIVFSADNGGPPPGDNTPLRGFKGSIYEGGVRGCAFANWPAHIPAGARIKEPMHVIDWYPTLIKLAGGSLEQKLPLDGRDVWPMLTAGAPSPHEAILCVQSPVRAALRQGDWKLLVMAGDAAKVESDGDGPTTKPNNKPKAKSKAAAKDEPVQLYNLASDVGESANLAKKEPERVEAMRAELAKLLKDAAAPGNSREAQ